MQGLTGYIYFISFTLCLLHVELLKINPIPSRSYIPGLPEVFEGSLKGLFLGVFERTLRSLLQVFYRLNYSPLLRYYPLTLHPLSQHPSILLKTYSPLEGGCWVMRGEES